MQSLRSHVLNLLTVLASVAFTILVFEIVLRFLPVAWGLPVEPPTAENPIQRYVANTPYVWSLGWNFYVVVHGRSNAQGFLADYDYDTKASQPLVAIVGDSFMEALHVPFAETVTGRLQAMLGTRGRAYVFAQSGAPLSQYVAYAQHACSIYHPQRLVVNVVGNDFDESLYTHRKRDGLFHLYPQPDGTFDYKLTPLPAPSVVERIARHSALSLYLARNVGVSNVINLFRSGETKAATNQSRYYVGNTLADANATRIDEGEKVIAWFVEALPKAACLAAKDIVIMVDAIRSEIYDDAPHRAAPMSYFGLMRQRLISEASTRGFKVIDMEPYFRAAYARDHLPFEFPTDGHWNSYAHAIATAAVRETLRDWAPLALEK